MRRVVGTRRTVRAVVALLVALAALPVAASAAPRLRPVLNLRVAATDARTVTLRWTDRSLGERRYEVAIGQRVVRLRANTRAYRARPPVGKLRRYRVRACTVRRCSSWSRAVVARAGPPPVAGPAPTLGGCQVFPADNPWNQPVDTRPLHPRSAQYVASISSEGARFLHPDFGSNPGYGIPFAVVPQAQAPVEVRFVEYGDESDPGPYPIPLTARVEAGSDAHTLALQQGTCRLYELYHARRVGDRWEAGSGAIFDLTSNRLRPDTWTSADAAGLPILPGLVRRDEVEAGAIRHALRMTVPHAQRAFIHPATHYGSTNDPDDPPMGLRLRLRADFDLSGYRGGARVILQALKRYGVIVADQGSGWYITGATDTGWDDEDLNQLKRVPGRAFEAVDTGPLRRP
jgi:hypothetical protein